MELPHVDVGKVAEEPANPAEPVPDGAVTEPQRRRGHRVWQGGVCVGIVTLETLPAWQELQPESSDLETGRFRQHSQ